MMSGQGEREDLSIALSSRLARTSAVVPYWKAQLPQAKPSSLMCSENAKLKRQLGDLSRDFQRLLGLHERSDAQVADLQNKLRQLRGELATKDKALELSRRTLDRLAEEKVEQESGSAADKAYIRKLESRLLSLRGALELQAECNKYKLQAENMAEKLRLAESRVAIAQDAQQQAEEEVAFLKRGIDLAAEQLTKSAGTEVPSTLLVALAKAQEDGMGMSVQLADGKQRLSEMASALEQARTHLVEQQKALDYMQEEAAQAAAQLRAAQGDLQAERSNVAELRQLCGALRQQVALLRNGQGELLHQVELERTAARTAQEKVRELEETCKQHAKAEAALREEVLQLSKQLRDLQAAAAAVHGSQGQQQAARGFKSPSRPLRPWLSPGKGGGIARHAAAAATAAGGSPTRMQRLQQLRGRGGGSPARAGGVGGSSHIGDVPHLESSYEIPLRQLMGAGRPRAEPVEHAGAPGEAPAARAALAGRAQQAKKPKQASDLDEQIAALEGDLAALSASCETRRLQELLLHGRQREGWGQQGGAGQHAAQQPPTPSSGPSEGEEAHSARLALPSLAAAKHAAGHVQADMHLVPAKLSLAQWGSGSDGQLSGPASGRDHPHALPPGDAGCGSNSELEGEAPYRIAAWRPGGEGAGGNGALEAADADALVLQASLSQHPLLPGPAGSTLDATAGAAAHAAAGSGSGSAAKKLAGFKRPPVPPLKLPIHAIDRYRGLSADELSSAGSEGPPSVRSAQHTARAKSPLHLAAAGAQPGEFMVFVNQAALGLNSPTATQQSGPSALWHTNPLAGSPSPLLAAGQPKSVAGACEAGYAAAGPAAVQAVQLGCEDVFPLPRRVECLQQIATAESSGSFGPQTGHPQQQQRTAGSEGRVTFEGSVSAGGQWEQAAPPQRQQQQLGSAMAVMTHSDDSSSLRQPGTSTPGAASLQLASAGSSGRSSAVAECILSESPEPPLPRQGEGGQAGAGHKAGGGGKQLPRVKASGLRISTLSLPSGATSWLNNSFDIEQLEVTSAWRRVWGQQQQPQPGGRGQRQAGPEQQQQEGLATLFELASMDMDCF